MIVLHIRLQMAGAVLYRKVRMSYPPSRGVGIKIGEHTFNVWPESKLFYDVATEDYVLEESRMTDGWATYQAIGFSEKEEPIEEGY